MTSCGVFIVNIEQISHVARKPSRQIFRIISKLVNINVSKVVGRSLGRSDGSLIY